MINRIIKTIAILLAAIASVSCEDFLAELFPAPSVPTRNVLLLYSAGYNNLASYLRDDIKDLESGWLPAKKNSADIVLVYSHFPTQGYSTPTSPALVRLTSDKEGKAVRDTLVVYPEGTISSSAEQLETVLTYIKDNFDSERYGMVFSSHATGYLPSEYYTKEDEALSQQKSIGQDHVVTDGIQTSYEIELSDFAKAIPMHLDYILFDACLMGGVEVAYELKDVVGKVGFSQTEVLAEGFCYSTLTQSLLLQEEPDVQKVCDDYFQQYDVQSGIYRSATISLIDCGNMNTLAEVCSRLFEKYADEISNVNAKNVQRFYRSGKHWFYDLESILINAKITDEELEELHYALNQCVLYKAHTPSFMNEFNIHIFSGLSMYLPNQGTKSLNDFYKSLKWNQDTGLVN